MTKNWTIFPKIEPDGEELANFSVYKQYEKAAQAGYGVLTGCTVSRNSSSQVDVASGTYTNNGIKKIYAGGNLTSISAAASGKHRYDLVYIDGADDTLKMASGVEETPDNTSNFLENYNPKPAALADTDWVVLAIVRVTESGIENTDFGTDKYATGSVANIIVSPFCGFDNDTLLIDSNGVGSVNSKKYGQIKGPYRIRHGDTSPLTLYTTPAFCKILWTVMKCQENNSSRTINIGTAADTDMFVADSELPDTTATASITNEHNKLIESVTAIIATIGGSGDTGEWDFWVYLVDLT